MPQIKIKVITFISARANSAIVQLPELTSPSTVCTRQSPGTVKWKRL